MMMSLKVVLPMAALLIIITPLLSSSLRFKYLYFIVNILIMAVGAEAGLFSSSFFIQSDHHHNKQSVISSPGCAAENEDSCLDHKHVEKMSGGGDEVVKTEKSGSETSIFFIGDESSDEEEVIVVDEDADLSDQELYHKAEIFIGNFYKQLKMQREESWKKLHHHLSHNNAS